MRTLTDDRGCLTACLTAGLLAALLAGLVGCSGSGSEAAPDVVTVTNGAAATPATPGATGSATPTASVSAPASPLPTAKSAPVSGSGLAATVKAAALRDRTVRVSVLVAGPLPIQGTGAAQAPSKLTMKATLAGQKSIAVTRAGGKVYLRLPAQTAPGKDWLLVPAKKGDPVTNMYDVSFAGYAQPVDLLATSATLASLGRFRAGGADTVDGVPATKYTVSTTATKAARLLPPAYQPIGPSRLRRGSATVSVWVDAAGRLLRTSTVARIPATKRVTVLIGYTGWGKPVQISAPPAADVGTLAG